MEKIFIVGAQKSGTTALHRYLSLHPEISMSSKKELHFFDDENIDWNQPNYTRLEVEMGRNDGLICGEATPIYMYWPRSIERLHAYNSEAKIIIIIRHPVYRAHSHWRMEVIRGNENLSFSDAIRSGRRRVQMSENGAHRLYSYVERGFYANQINHLLNYYPRSQIHIATTDQLWLKPKFTLSSIEKFLNVSHKLNPKMEYIIAASTDAPDQMSRADFAFLLDLFSSDIHETSKLAGLAIEEWLDEKYSEPVKR